MATDTSSRRWRIVVAGGIGSGKSTVGKLLAAKGAHVIDADVVGHEVLRSAAVVGAIGEEWPDVVDDGQVDRGALGAVVFTDPAALRHLESITHPAIRRQILGEVAAHSDQHVVVELPLMPDWLGAGWTTWIVDSSERARIDRIIERGGAPEDTAARMSAQPTRDRWIAAADVVISNDADLDRLAEQVDRAWQELGE